MSDRLDDDNASRRYDRRTVLKAAAAVGVAGPALWRAAPAAAATPAIGPRWVGYGADPTSQMYVTWSAGSAGGAVTTLTAPQVRYGPTTAYGKTVKAVPKTVPMPTPSTGEPAEHTVYSTALLSGLAHGTPYHYQVSNDGKTWSADAAFTTARAKPANFRFTAFGDQAAGAGTAVPMMSLVAALKPTFHVVPGDLAYATSDGEHYPNVAGFNPAQWDKYLGVISPVAQSIPWQASVGAHEVEPLDQFGYAGFVTRFPQPYATASGSPVVHTFSYANVAVIHVDGNDLSAQETINTGYTAGAQTAWLESQLAAYRAAGSGIDFVVVVVNCCCFSSNTNHGSDGGVRDAWTPLFDTYQVDLVISGHVHAYERSNPIRSGVVTRHVAAGGTVDPTVDGTTYVCAGGGGNGLYTSWYGATDSGDAGSTTAPKVWRWSGGDTASGGSGKSVQVTDTVTGFSACRRAAWHCLAIDVVVPTAANPVTTLTVQAVMPAQTTTAVTSVSSPTVIDSVTITRTTG